MISATYICYLGSVRVKHEKCTIRLRFKVANERCRWNFLLKLLQQYSKRMGSKNDAFKRRFCRYEQGSN